MKEPIRKPWIWVVLAVIVLAGVPWYLPEGTLEPLVLGVPYWLLVAVAFSLILCGFLSWLCLTQWNVVEDEEERERAGRREDAGNSESREG